MNATAPFGGDVLIADTSVWLRADRFPEPLKDEWTRALMNDQIATTPFVVFELFYRARNSRQRFERWRATLDGLRRVLIPDGSVYSLAREAYVADRDESVRRHATRRHSQRSHSNVYPLPRSSRRQGLPPVTGAQLPELCRTTSRCGLVTRMRASSTGRSSTALEGLASAVRSR